MKVFMMRKRLRVSFHFNLLKFTSNKIPIPTILDHWTEPMSSTEYLFHKDSRTIKKLH